MVRPVIYGIFLLLAFSFAAFAGEQQDAPLFLSKVRVKDFGEPRLVELQPVDGTLVPEGWYKIHGSDGPEADWGGDWGMVLAAQKGLGKTDPTGRVFVKLLYGGNDHPISRLDGACLHAAQTTHDMLNCGYGGAKHWEVELNYLMSNLEIDFSEPVANEIRTAHDAWQIYRDRLTSAQNRYYEENGGQIVRVQGVALYVSLYKSHYQDLLFLMGY